MSRISPEKAFENVEAKVRRIDLLDALGAVATLALFAATKHKRFGRAVTWQVGMAIVV